MADNIDKKNRVAATFEPPGPLETLRVFDRLEVGPVRLEPKKLTAPYCLERNGREERTDLVYSYEEAVFTPDDPASRNLADMIAAQVAVNYGLFCHSLVFNGCFDEPDRRFLREMAENTAREIYVNKFLQSNPFLTGSAACLEPVKQKTYLQASIRFKGPSAASLAEKWSLWTTDKNRHCVLSSGGKDSLLSFGLLSEIGKETHPIFVNESGRHWFTALNAYRHFREHIPRTARIWVNSDRVFSWMLQRMPFIRRDFQSVRSDDYPIRLWTVAVFLFGVLPLVNRRGIGRILVGDEFDTSVKAVHHGIPHYSGLYDQSIWFDTTLSRYFMRKGWAVSQFSLLRPLSEILIEKILTERYPQLQQHQISCHAAHKHEDRIRPCGRCEKCRRIVCMLKAIDADPLHCGYTEEQVRHCLSSFAQKELSQEAAGREHLGHLLAEKGLIANDQPNGGSWTAHPEVMKLRFDSQRSPINALPPDLRQPIYRIFLQHADGTVRRSGKTWQDVDPLTDPDFQVPYAFELESRQPAVEFQAGDDTSYLWGEMTSAEAERRLNEVDIALLPVGAVEQHGPHLPLDTDSFDAEYLARRVASACSPPAPLVLPGIAYGVSYHHSDFRGTLGISNETLSRLVYEIGMSAARNGIQKLVIINGHGGNSPSLHYAAQMINRDSRIFVCVDSGESSDVDIYRLVETPNDVHAGEVETSTCLAVRPQLVRMDLAQRSVPEFSSRYLEFTGKRGIAWYTHTRALSHQGVLGDPTKASAEKGKKIWEIMIAHLVSLVEDVKGCSLEELYHRS